VGVPVLRKDFIVTERQLDETVLLGADAVLLIQRLLSPSQLADLVGHARGLGLDVLLELFVDEDPEPAVASGAAILGVNARNLATFEVRLDLVEAMAAALPADRVRVAESGITGSANVRRLVVAGYDAFLVGEHLVRSEDPAAAVRELRDVPAGHGHRSEDRGSRIEHPESSNRRPAASDDSVGNGNGNGNGNG
jgi:indole-3-glycerol phosphate synthase